MTKVIRGEFEENVDVKLDDVLLTCDTQLESFNNEIGQLNGMDDNSKHEADDDMGYDPSDVAFIEWLGSKFFNYKTMDHYTMKALWIYLIRGDDEVELTDEESSDVED
nr:C2 calcium/lipid-binding domain, CaLB [Tanacetum cinerariifolium]